jgi:hypothetical protein
MWIRASHVLILFLACAPLGAQSWEALRGVQGQRVKVLETGGGERKGICETVSGESITLQTGNQRMVIERAKVRRVQVGSGARRVRNIVIGAAIGVAVAVTVDQTVGTYLRNETGDSGRGITYAAPIVVFGGIGAALPGYRTVYRAR